MCISGCWTSPQIHTSPVSALDAGHHRSNTRQKKPMLRKVLLGLLLLLSMASDGSAQSRSQDASLDSILQPYLGRYGLPALAAAVVKNGEVIASGAVGTRRAGTNSPVSIDDRFHIGSDTKSMTALIAAMFVEGGKLHWTSTVGEAFPELAA